MTPTAGNIGGSTRTSDSARPRGPGIVYLVLSAGLLGLLSTLALTTAQTPPPTIAEFAPQAIEQIEDAPVEQTSEFGAGDAGAPGEGSDSEDPGADDPPLAEEQVIDVPRIRRCVGDPPRQIEDPQSPPCVPYWDGDNGGATWQGVTRNEIRIAISGGEDDEVTTKTYEYLVPFFNMRFEFYGRRMIIVPAGVGDPADPVQQRNAATSVDEEYQAFAAGSMVYGFHFQEELARRSVVSVGRNSDFTEPYLRTRAPHIWSYPMAADRMFQNMGGWTCRRLADSRATHAGPPYDLDERTFGVVFWKRSRDVPVTSESLLRELSRCGIDPAVTIEFSDEDFWDSRNVALQMQNAGVTSIIFLAHAGHQGELARNASSQGYFPEWLVASYGEQDYPWVSRLSVPKEHLEQTFGLSFQPRQVRRDLTPPWWALQEANPQATQDPLYGNAVGLSTLTFRYRDLLLLASGIQMAGPELTPATFMRGLQGARFPNPAHPIMAGDVGFRGNFTMTEDATEWWWSNTARGPSEDDVGTLCYVDGGARHQKDTWPRGDDVFFTGPCDSGR